MAKEAVEKVREAEEKALEIASEAEQKAAALLATAGEAAVKRFEEVKAEEARKMTEALDAARVKADGDFDAFKAEVSAKCENRREEMMKNSENTIGRIIEAVKKG